MRRFISSGLLLFALSIAFTASSFAQSGDATTTGTSRAFNPAISLNALMLGHFLDGTTAEDPAYEGPPEEGIILEEVELRFTAAVDTYARANATISTAEGEIDVEEAYASFGFVVTSSVAIAGVLLVFCFLIVPGIVGILFGRSLRGRLLVGWTVGWLVSILGCLVSYLGDLPTGATVVCCFGIALVLATFLRRLTES